MPLKHEWDRPPARSSWAGSGMGADVWIGARSVFGRMSRTTSSSRSGTRTPSHLQVMVPLVFRSSICESGEARRPWPHSGKECERAGNEPWGAIGVADRRHIGIGGGGGARRESGAGADGWGPWSEGRSGNSGSGRSGEARVGLPAGGRSLGSASGRELPTSASSEGAAALGGPNRSARAALRLSAPALWCVRGPWRWR